MLPIVAALLVSSSWASPISRPSEVLTPVIGAPVDSPVSNYQWSAGWVTEMPIHESCNSSLRTSIRKGLNEMVQLSEHARQHLLRWGHKSEIVQKYFGNGSTAHVVGWFDRIVLADKSDMLLRCDDPDENCDAHPGWGSYWRPNATTEVSMCPMAFWGYRPLDYICNNGHEVAKTGLDMFWSTEFMHRLFHAPVINEDIVSHFADDFNGLLEVAKTEPEKSVVDMDAFQYFALDVWAYDIAAPGMGCTGQQPVKDAQPAVTTTANDAMVSETATATTSSALSVS
ncbi:major allergen Asp f 2-like protein [Metarhizium rileyi]|uniref:Major allergen Asp f 2-like protein n=1 Tax=Metarhizium rileyi (strain RCEF 4871) TaxID=1649241 RepID=A0A166YSP2_METRR|nr:major allergen Asp f 2-like protein [Metarhizium rileyi RCEF 4871]